MTTYVNWLSDDDVITPGLTSSLTPNIASDPSGITLSACCKYDALKPTQNSPPVKSTSIVSLASPISGLVEETVSAPAARPSLTP